MANLRSVAPRHLTKKKKSRFQKYAALTTGAKFHFPRSSEVFVKIGDAFSVSTRSGKDCIPNLFETVVFCGYQPHYYPIAGA